MRHIVPLLFLAAACSRVTEDPASSAATTTPAREPPGPASITAADIAQRIGVIAHDSMLGRDTPSRGLNLTATYIAKEFARLGLKPAGDRGTYLQQFAIEQRQVLVEQSAVTLRMPGGAAVRLPFTWSAWLLSGSATVQAVRGPVVLLGGPIDPAAFRDRDFKDRIAVWAPDFRNMPANGNQVAGTMFKAGARGMVVISNQDSSDFAGFIAQQGRPRTAIGGGGGSDPLITFVTEPAVVAQFPGAAQTFAELRGASAMTVRPVTDWQAEILVRDSLLEAIAAPNTIGILEGSDPVLRSEYLVYSAHMDHIGITPGQADSINNGADDDASGTVAVIELAEAFSQKGARPKRSIIFITVSGEEKGLWGSAHFADHPTVPVANMVANLNLDMIGRNWKDTIVVIGREHSDLGTTLDRVAGLHPELNMTPIPDRWPEEHLYFRSDHYNFARKGVPILFFTSGLHADYHQVTDSPEKIDSEKEARLLKLLYYLGQDIGNAPARPAWNPESRQQIVEAGGTLSIFLPHARHSR